MQDNTESYLARSASFVWSPRSVVIFTATSSPWSVAFQTQPCAPTPTCFKILISRSSISPKGASSRVCRTIGGVRLRCTSSSCGHGSCATMFRCSAGEGPGTSSPSRAAGSAVASFPIPGHALRRVLIRSFVASVQNMTCNSKLQQISPRSFRAVAGNVVSLVCSHMKSSRVAQTLGLKQEVASNFCSSCCIWLLVLCIRHDR